MESWCEWFLFYNQYVVFRPCTDRCFLRSVLFLFSAGAEVDMQVEAGAAAQLKPSVVWVKPLAKDASYFLLWWKWRANEWGKRERRARLEWSAGSMCVRNRRKPSYKQYLKCHKTEFHSLWLLQNKKKKQQILWWAHVCDMYLPVI